jgi:hypothetical protein
MYPSDSSEERSWTLVSGMLSRYLHSSWAKEAQRAGACACQRGVYFGGVLGGEFLTWCGRVPYHRDSGKRAFGTGGKGPGKVGFVFAKMGPWGCRLSGLFHNARSNLSASLRPH